MSKQNNVGAGPVSARNKQNGITLIALIITIIVMLILVGVTVSVSLNGGLFSKAKKAGEDYETAAQKDAEILNEPIEIDGKLYATYEDYLNNTPMKEWKETTKPSGWSNNVKAVTDGKDTIPLPNGFKISTNETEDEVAEGLVIKDGENEFVWIPVANAASYTEGNFRPEKQYMELPDGSREVIFEEAQKNLDDVYGINYYDYDDFTYEEDSLNIQTNIQIYGGFYVGRYETTIDGNTVGIQKGKTVLTAATPLTEQANYGWWGLYKVQKDIYANHTSVGSLMISTGQWNKIMQFTGYGDAYRESNTYRKEFTIELSGSSYATNNTEYDMSKNIYDLAGNVREYSMNPENNGSNYDRLLCGGNVCSAFNVDYIGVNSSAADIRSLQDSPWGGNEYAGSRIVLYIK